MAQTGIAVYCTAAPDEKERGGNREVKKVIRIRVTNAT